MFINIHKYKVKMQLNTFRRSLRSRKNSSLFGVYLHLAAKSRNASGHEKKQQPAN